MLIHGLSSYKHKYTNEHYSVKYSSSIKCVSPFLTYLIVAFYKHRWDIEKVYYQFKTKFEERKSWATSQTAKQAQATFQCLLHNLSLLIEEKVEREEDLTDEVAQALQKGRKRKPAKGFINKIVQRATHRTLRFIRWLRNSLRSQRSYSQSIARLATIYQEQM